MDLRMDSHDVLHPLALRQPGKDVEAPVQGQARGEKDRQFRGEGEEVALRPPEADPALQLLLLGRLPSKG